MKIKDFITQKKWALISGCAFLVIFAIIMGVFVSNIYQKLHSVQRQNDLLSSNVNSLETSLATLKSSIDDLIENIKAYSGDQLLLTSLESDLESVQSELSEFTALNDKVEDLLSLKAILDQLNNKLKNLNSEITSVKPVEDVQISDSDVPGDSIMPANSLPEDIIKAGNEIIVTIRADTISDMYGYQFNLNFDNSKVSYKSGPKSSISEISTIFKKDFPDYLLIGATMIGDKPGYSGNDVDVCTLVFTANEDVDPSSFVISGVNTVDSAQKYVQNISGWSCEAKVN